MTHYKSDKTHKNQKNSVNRSADADLLPQEQPELFYQLVGEEGEPIEQPKVKLVEEDMWLELNSNTEGHPEFILQNAKNHYPASYAGYWGKPEQVYEEAVLPVAEEVLINGSLTNFQKGMIGLGVLGAATGISLGSAGGSGSSGDSAEKVAAKAPVITFNPIAEDDIINLLESRQESTVLSGRVEHAKDNDEIVITVGQAVYKGFIADKQFSVPVDTKSLLNHGKVSAAVSTADGESNTLTGHTEHTYSVDTEYAPTISLNKIAGDNVLNIEESNNTVTVTGTVTDVADNEDIVISCGCESCGSVKWIDIVTKVQNGSFTVDFEGAQLSKNGYNLIKAKVTSKDTAGNTAAVETIQEYTKDLEAPRVSVEINTIAGNNILTKAKQAQQEQTVSGTIGGLQEGEKIREVSVSVGGQNYAAQVEGNLYSVNIPSSELAKTDNVNVSVTVTDNAGNSATAENSRSYRVGELEPVITLNAIADDNFINRAEFERGEFILSGKVENVEDGTEIILRSGNKTLTAQVENGEFSVIADDIFLGILPTTENSDGLVTATVKLDADSAAESTYSAQQSYKVDLQNKTALTLHSVTDDNTLNATEMSRSHVTVSGIVTDGAEGGIVTIKIGQATYTAQIQADGSYSVEAEIAKIAPNGNDGKYWVSASVERVDSAGNGDKGTISFARTFSINQSAPNGTVVFDPIADDNVINKTESELQTIRVTGRILGLGEGDDVVSTTVSVGGNEYTANVTGSAFNVEIPVNVLVANSQITGRAELKDAGGQTASAVEGSQNYSQKITEPHVDITINTVNGGKAINIESLHQDIILTGSFELGENVVRGTEEVTIDIGGVSYKAEVSETTWRLSVPAAVLAAHNAKPEITVSISVTDEHGNKASDTVKGQYTVDTVAPVPVIELNPLNQNNVITDGDASNTTTTLTGRVTGDFKPNDKVDITVGNVKKEVLVGADGTFQVALETSQLTASEKPVITAAIATADDAGNSAGAQTSLAYSVNKGNLGIELDVITGDDLINVTEAKQEIAISGKVTGTDAKEGQIVDLLVNGKTIKATVGSGLTFTTKIAASELISDGDYTVQASVSNNGSTAKTARVYKLSSEVAASIDITGIDSDFSIDTAQAFSNTRIGGVIELEGMFAQGLNSGRMRQITVNIDDKTYKAGVKSDRSFFLDIPTKELVKLNGKPISFKVEADPQLFDLTKTGDNTYRVNNLKRFEAVQVKDIKFDSPYIIKDTKTDGYVVSGVKDSAAVIHGKVGGTAKAGDKVVLEIGQKVYQTEVDSTGKAFSVEVSAADLVADKDQIIKAVLKTADLSGRSVTVSDVEKYTVVKQNDGKLVESHSKPAIINSEHISSGYNFPYFIDKIGNTNGRSYNIPFGGDQNGPTVVKYHFMTLDEIGTLSENHNRYVDRISMRSYPSELQDIVRNAYKEISAVTNLQFVEVGTMAEANTNYYMGDLKSGFEGASAIAYNGGLIAWNSRHNYMGWGKDFLHYTVLHEVTHTLGMTHTSHGFKGDYAPEESIEFSNMSYNAYANNGFFIEKGQLRTYDLAYLHYTAGMNKTVRTGNDIYTFKNYNMYSQDSDLYIWDAGGVDTFDASQEKAGVHVNLTPGSWIYVGNELSKTFGVKSAATYDMRSYFNLAHDASITGNARNEKVTLNTYTEGQAFIGYGTQIENLVGSQHNDVLAGNRADNNISGGAGNDIIRGEAGNDYLDGGLGEDTLIGGTGDDSYVIDNERDSIEELENQGTDHVYSTITYTLGNYLENLTLLGSNTINGTGNAAANTLRGNDADNVLNGMDGDDRIIGGGGNDTLTGGNGRDTFVFDQILDGSVSTISDFVYGEDTIELSTAIFGELKNNQSWFNSHISYESSTGRLYYDADGAGKTDKIHFAALKADLTIDETSFNIV